MTMIKVINMVARAKVGFLVDDLSVSAYTHDWIKFVEERNEFDSPVIITGYRREVGSVGFVSKLKKILKGKNVISSINTVLYYFLYKLISVIEFKRANFQYSKYGRSVSIDRNRYDLIEVCGKWSSSGLVVRFQSEDIEKIRELDLDVIVRCGSGILKGDILKSSKFGVFSFHHGDNRVNRGGPSGFWEVINRESSSGFTLQQLTEELDGGRVIMRGNTTTKPFWFLNNAHLLEKSQYFMKKALLDVSNRTLKFENEVFLYDNVLYKHGSFSVLLKYMFVVYSPSIFNRLRRVFSGYKDLKWHVAFKEGNNLNDSLFRYTSVDNPTGRFLADPFLVTNGSKHYCFVEDYFYSEHKGKVSVLEFDKGSYKFLGVILDEPFHLSFPYVFESEGEHYLVPESSENRQIRLYKAIDFPMKWKLEEVILNDVAAVDTCILKKDGMWYMLTNICSSDIGDASAELHVYYSNDLINGKWLPISSGNPVVFDSRKARNAGLFQREGKIYRVNQVQDIGHYGKSFAINEVVNLSKDSYEEREVTSVQAKFKEDIVSTHHFHCSDYYKVLDYATLEKNSK
ncbi:glucosamine inositolphosphorylceramide transferase family protein [Vibrio sp. LaRot3]|uniref:glucosamine inositolphosphorylceramide transferase family protein n=1 Tax=Vibrio sp. LaRot3 TaxID=2998829 RepID=UPI0022CE06FB|nr:hypothetical protein [Vibrio sp. LaRot3]MDA0149399.1 hypothetical protein [Vibrio sp. LaRot3]